MKMKDLNDNTLTRLFNSRKAALFLGKPGVGKTERVQQFAKSKGLGLVDDFDLTSVDAPDIRGFAVPSKDAGGRCHEVYIATDS